MRTGLSFSEENKIIHVHGSEGRDITIKAGSLVPSAHLAAEKLVQDNDVEIWCAKLFKRETDKIDRITKDAKEKARMKSLLKTPEGVKGMRARARNNAVAELAETIARNAHERCAAIASECADRIEDIIKNISIVG